MNRDIGKNDTGVLLQGCGPHFTAVITALCGIVAFFTVPIKVIPLQGFLPVSKQLPDSLRVQSQQPSHMASCQWPGWSQKPSVVQPVWIDDFLQHPRQNGYFSFQGQGVNEYSRRKKKGTQIKNARKLEVPVWLGK